MEIAACPDLTPVFPVCAFCCVHQDFCVKTCFLGTYLLLSGGYHSVYSKILFRQIICYFAKNWICLRIAVPFDVLVFLPLCLLMQLSVSYWTALLLS